MESKARISREAWGRIRSSRFSSITLATRREARNPRLSSNCPHYWVNYCPRNQGVNPHYGVFLGDTFTPWNLYKLPSLLWERGRKILGKQRTSVVSRISTKTSSWKKREFNSSNNLLRTSSFLPTISLRSLVDRSCVTSSTIQRENSQRTWHSPGQRKTRFTFHHHIKNPALNKWEI